MLDAIKKLDKKFLITFGCIIFIPIFIIVLLLILQGCGNRKVTYDKYEEKMIEASQKYMEDNEKELKGEGESLLIELKDLIDDEYIKSPEKLLKDDSCDGSVLVRRNGSSVEKNEGGFLNYISNLNCKEYNSPTLMSKIKEGLVVEGAGLYALDDGFVFRGKDVKNYVSIDKEIYRIISIDEQGLAKLIKEDGERLETYWDMKYNLDTEDYSGKNIYADSNIVESLKEFYTDDTFTLEMKKHLVAKDVCVGARAIGDLAIYNNSDCNSIIEDQFISLIDISDYAKASIDKDCNSLEAMSCGNYNYFESIDVDSWLANPVSNNSYQVYYLNNGTVDYKDASKYEEYNIVIYIDSLEIVSGNGSLEEPFVLTMLEK